MNILEHIKTDNRPISHIARNMAGSWTIAYKKYDNYTNVSLSSCQKLTDEDIETIRGMGILVFDFLKVSSDNFLPMLHKMEDLAKFNCY